jgi:hypothetical protein
MPSGRQVPIEGKVTVERCLGRQCPADARCPPRAKKQLSWESWC